MRGACRRRRAAILAHGRGGRRAGRPPWCPACSSLLPAALLGRRMWRDALATTGLHPSTLAAAAVWAGWPNACLLAAPPAAATMWLPPKNRDSPGEGWHASFAMTFF